MRGREAGGEGEGSGDKGEGSGVWGPPRPPPQKASNKCNKRQFNHLENDLR